MNPEYQKVVDTIFARQDLSIEQKNAEANKAKAFFFPDTATASTPAPLAAEPTPDVAGMSAGEKAGYLANMTDRALRKLAGAGINTGLTMAGGVAGAKYLPQVLRSLTPAAMKNLLSAAELAPAAESAAAGTGFSLGSTVAQEAGALSGVTEVPQSAIGEGMMQGVLPELGTFAGRIVGQGLGGNVGQYYGGLAGGYLGAELSGQPGPFGILGPMIEGRSIGKAPPLADPVQKAAVEAGDIPGMRIATQEPGSVARVENLAAGTASRQPDLLKALSGEIPQNNPMSPETRLDFVQQGQGQVPKYIEELAGKQQAAVSSPWGFPADQGLLAKQALEDAVANNSPTGRVAKLLGAPTMDRNDFGEWIAGAGRRAIEDKFHTPASQAYEDVKAIASTKPLAGARQLSADVLQKIQQEKANFTSSLLGRAGEPAGMSGAQLAAEKSVSEYDDFLNRRVPLARSPRDFTEIITDLNSMIRKTSQPEVEAFLLRVRGHMEDALRQTDSAVSSALDTARKKWYDFRTLERRYDRATGNAVVTERTAETGTKGLFKTDLYTPEIEDVFNKLGLGATLKEAQKRVARHEAIAKMTEKGVVDDGVLDKLISSGALPASERPALVAAARKAFAEGMNNVTPEQVFTALRQRGSEVPVEVRIGTTGLIKKLPPAQIVDLKWAEIRNAVEASTDPATGMIDHDKMLQRLGKGSFFDEVFGTGDMPTRLGKVRMAEEEYRLVAPFLKAHAEGNPHLVVDALSSLKGNPQSISLYMQTLPPDVRENFQKSVLGAMISNISGEIDPAQIRRVLSPGNLNEPVLDSLLYGMPADKAQQTKTMLKALRRVAENTQAMESYQDLTGWARRLFSLGGTARTVAGAMAGAMGSKITGAAALGTIGMGAATGYAVPKVIGAALLDNTKDFGQQVRLLLSRTMKSQPPEGEEQ